MAYTCRVCGFSHSCWCGGKKCRCGMNLGEARVAEKIVKEYQVEDKDLLVSLIKQQKNLSYILKELNLIPREQEEITTTIAKGDITYKDLGMKSIYCEYSSFNENAECKFCGRKRKEGYMKPCLYLLEQNGKLNG